MHGQTTQASLSRSSSVLPDPAGIHLDVALQLLRQAGYPDRLESAACEPRDLQEIIDALCELSVHDALTGLGNARHFRSSLEREVDRVSRSGETALLLLIDLDRFKSINDEHGHLAGDEVLRTVAKVLGHNIRSMDTAARHGGDEFAVILPNCPARVGCAIAERIREEVSLAAVTLADGTVLRATVTIGGAFIPVWQKITPAEVIARADQKLYSAKAAGRNNVFIEMPEASCVSNDEKHFLFDTLKQQS
jgi:diguanylate cyclase (GGDEF)-like protein